MLRFYYEELLPDGYVGFFEVHANKEDWIWRYFAGPTTSRTYDNPFVSGFSKDPFMLIRKDGSVSFYRGSGNNVTGGCRSYQDILSVWWDILSVWWDMHKDDLVCAKILMAEMLGSES
jgi:hypothetical protein